MGRVYVSDFEAGALAGQTARPEGREAALVGDFRERVGLIHELAELRRAEELAHRRRRRLGVDQIVGHHGVDFHRRHALANRPLHAQQPDPVLIFHQFADRADAAVAEMIDVVDFAAAVLEADQRAQDFQHVGLAQHPHLIVGLEAQAGVHLDPADRREIVALAIEEQALEQRLGGFESRRLARTHHAVDVDQRVFAAGVAVGGHGVAHVGADIDMVDGQHGNLADSGLFQLFDRRQGQLVAGLVIDLAGLLVDHVSGEVLAGQLFGRNQLFGQALLAQLLGKARRDLDAGRHHHLAGGGVDQVRGQLEVLEALGVERRLPAGAGAGVGNRAVEGGENLFLAHALGLVGRQRLAPSGAQLLGVGAVECEQQGGRRQLAPTVDAHIHQVLGVEFEVEPGAAIGNDPRGEEILTRAVGLALVVIEEDARRPVHLGDDHALGAVDHESAVRGHERHVAHIDILLLDVSDRAQTGILLDVEHRETERHLERRREGHAALLALFDIVFGLFQLVLHEVEHGAIGEVLDREYRLEHFLQADEHPLFGRHVHLKEMVVRTALHLDEVRHLGDFRNPPEAFPNTLASRKGFSHGCPRLQILAQSLAAPDRAKGAYHAEDATTGRRRKPSPSGVALCVTMIVKVRLLNFDGRASVFKLLLDLRGIFFRDAFLDSLGRTLDQILGFLEAEAGDGAHFLDHVDLLIASGGEDHVELGLLFHRSGGDGNRSGGGHRSGGRNAPLLFQHLRQLGGLDHGQRRQLINKLFQLRHLSTPRDMNFGNGWVYRPHAASP